MKRIAFFCIAFLIFLSNSHAQRILMEKRFKDCHISDAEVLDDGYIVLGHKDREILQNNSYDRRHTPFVAKLNASMDVVWEKKFEEFPHRGMKDLSVTADGIYVMGTDYRGKYRNKGGGWLVKLSHEGGMLWEKHYTHAGHYCTEGRWIMELQDKSQLILTMAFRQPGSNGNPWIHRIDAKGNTMWTKRLGNQYYYAFSQANLLNDDGSVLITGGAYHSRDQFMRSACHAWIYRFHPDRPDQPMIDKTHDRFKSPVLWSAIPLEKGGWYVLGQARGSAGGQSSAILMEFDRVGNLMESREYKLDSGLNPRDMIYDTASGHLVVAGYSGRPISVSNYKLHVFELDQDLQVLDHRVGDPGMYWKLVPFSSGEMFAVSSVGVQVIE